MHTKLKLFKPAAFLLIATALLSCKKIEEFNKDPDITPLKEGFQISAAVGHCASLAHMAFNGQPLPENVSFQSGSNSEYPGSGILYVNVSDNYPLPYNQNIGDIIIAGLWDNTGGGGVISIIFADVNLFTQDFKFYGIHTVPVAKRHTTGELITVFAEQDIVIGEGSDTLMNLSLSRPEFNMELERAESERPEDVFVAVQQNVWFLTIDQNEPADVYDDSYEINGGGQMAKVADDAGGITYHAMIKTQYNFANCSFNPINGVGFIQNIQAGSSFDFGNITLEFHPSCDGKAKVKVGTGEYLGANGKNVNLHFN